MLLSHTLPLTCFCFFLALGHIHWPYGGLMWPCVGFTTIICLCFFDWSKMSFSPAVWFIAKKRSIIPDVFFPGFISVCCQPSHGSMILSCFFCFVRDSKKKKKRKVLQSIWRVDISLDIFIPWQRFISVCNHNFIFTDSNPLRNGVFSPQCFQGLMVDFRLSKVYT